MGYGVWGCMGMGYNVWCMGMRDKVGLDEMLISGVNEIPFVTQYF